MLYSNEVHQHIREGGFFFYDEYKEENALHKCCRGGNKDIVPLLLEKKFDVNKATKDDRSPLHIACWYKHTEIVKMLLIEDAEKNILDIRKKTPLHLAVERDSKEITELLLYFGAETDLLDKGNETPLHIALKIGSMELVAMLLDFKAGYDISNGKSKTAFDIAIWGGYGKFQMIMISHILLQKFCNCEISPRILIFFDLTQKLRRTIMICEEELNVMQNTCIKDISCFQLITMSIYSLAKIISNNEMRLSLEQIIIQQVFPSYTTIIAQRFARALKIYYFRKELANMIQDILQIIPLECIECIIDFFSEKDLIVSAHLFGLNKNEMELLMIEMVTRDHLIVGNEHMF